MSFLNSAVENQIGNDNNLSGGEGENDLSAKLSKYQTRDPIPNDNIFFIELGFGEFFFLPLFFFHQLNHTS